MRFDDFVRQNGIPFVPAEQFDDYLVEVAVPADWEAVQPSSGPRVWVWRNDPFKERFCANAVLTLARADAVLDPAGVFEMLCEWQAQMLPGIHEVNRALAEDRVGPGVMGTLELLANADVGVLESVVIARIIATDTQTLIAQLTFTALPESPVRRSQIGFGVIPVPRTALSAPGLPGGTPVSRPAEAR